MGCFVSLASAVWKEVTPRYCEYCGKNLSEVKFFHTREQCVKRLESLSNAVYDEYGTKVDLKKVTENLQTMRTSQTP